MTETVHKIFTEIDSTNKRSGEIECHGDDFLAIVTELKRRNAHMHRIEAMVNGKAGYRVHWYFPLKTEAQPELLPAAPQSYLMPR